MADDFDRTRFGARLGTQRLGRALRVLATTASTNDDAWASLPTLGDGATVVALAQTAGRGRAGRTWAHVPGRGLALSVALWLPGEARDAGVIPLAAGLALVRTCHALGARAARLKWPNDVMVDGRKLAGVLCEVRQAAGGAEAGEARAAAVVIGVGVNVAHAREDFPEALRDRATSLALAGAAAGIEDVAAGFLNALEPLWDELRGGRSADVIAEWSRWGAHWGQWVCVQTPAGPVEGVAQRLGEEGGLVLRADTGVETTVLAGDLTSSREGCDAA